MKMRDVSIRTKLLISNLVMVVAPLLIIGAALLLFYDVKLLQNLFGREDKLLGLFVAIALLVALLINGVIIFSFTRGVIRPMQQLQQAAREVGAGNLDCEINYRSQNEMGQVYADFERMRQRLKEAEAQQKRFDENRKDIIAGISHDLGTPLTSIKGYVSGILDGIADSPEKQRRYLETVYNTADDMDKLVNQFALFSRLDMDVLPFFFEKTDAFACIEKDLFEIEENLRRNGIRFEYVNTQREKIPYIKIDPMQIKRVEINLLENCIKYKRSDRTDSLVRLTYAILSDQRQLQVTLEGNGKQVTDEDCAKIFDTFYRTTSARTDVLNGSGLGLAVCRKIMERHDGSISARPSELGGLAIDILLPIVSIEERESNK